MTEYIVNADEENSLMYGRKYEELIRCKDCRYSYEGCTKYVCERPFHEFTVEPDGYCAWAERKTE